MDSAAELSAVLGRDRFSAISMDSRGCKVARRSGLEWLIWTKGSRKELWHCVIQNRDRSDDSQVSGREKCRQPCGDHRIRSRSRHRLRSPARFAECAPPRTGKLWMVECLTLRND